MARTSNSLKAQRIMRAVQADANAAQAFSAIAGSLARLSGDAPLTDIDQLFAGVFAAQPEGAALLAGMVAQTGADPDMAGRLRDLDGADLGDTLRRFDPARALDRAGGPDLKGQFDGLVRKAQANLAGRAGTTPAPGNPGSGAGDSPKDPQGQTTLEVTRPDGTTVKVTSQPGGTQASETPEKPTDKPKGPPTVYLGEDEKAEFLYAIALDRIEGLTTSDALTLAIASLGTSTLIGVDDELAFLAQGVARFRSGIRTPFVVPSLGVHEDVSKGDVLSDRFDAVKPDDQNSLKLSRAETFWVNKAQFRGDTTIGQVPILVDMAPFDLADFLRANIQFSLFEDDSDSKDKINQILTLLQEAATLGQQALSATGGGGPLLSATLSTFDTNKVFLRLNAALQSLIRDRDRIDTHDFIVSAGQIRAAFNQSGNIRAYPPRSNPPSFEYVTDRPEQVVTLKGDGAEYRVSIRYERHSIA